MKVIELKDVKKSYGKNEILHGISLDIEEGSIHGLVGRNGCGKTTLIKCLTGIYEQIMEQVKEAAWKGYLKPGDALPSVRKLALSLSVTPNTVAKAYQLLEKEKVIITIRGKGAFLAENASQEVDKGKMQEIKTSLKEILSELRYEGYDEEKIASLIHEIYQDLEG